MDVKDEVILIQVILDLYSATLIGQDEARKALSTIPRFSTSCFWNEEQVNKKVKLEINEDKRLEIMKQSKEIVDKANRINWDNPMDDAGRDFLDSIINLSTNIFNQVA